MQRFVQEAAKRKWKGGDECEYLAWNYRRRVRAPARTITVVRPEFPETEPLYGPKCSIMEHNLQVGKLNPSKLYFSLKGFLRYCLAEPEYCPILVIRYLRILSKLTIFDKHSHDDPFTYFRFRRENPREKCV